MSSNGIVGLNSLSNNIDLDNKKIVNNYDDNFKTELIKVLEEGLKEISERFFFKYNSLLKQIDINTTN